MDSSNDAYDHVALISKILFSETVKTLLGRGTIFSNDTEFSN